MKQDNPMAKTRKNPAERIKALMAEALELAQSSNIQLVTFWCDVDSAGKGEVDAALNCERPFISAVVEQLGSILRKTSPSIARAESQAEPE